MLVLKADRNLLCRGATIEVDLQRTCQSCQLVIKVNEKYNRFGNSFYRDCLLIALTSFCYKQNFFLYAFLMHFIL